MRTWKFLSAKDGTVAVEFAFIAPILIVLFLGSVELCYALICKEKVSTVAASASDLVARVPPETGHVDEVGIRVEECGQRPDRGDSTLPRTQRRLPLAD